MRYATRKPKATRHWPLSSLDRLEERALMTVSATHSTLVPLFAEVSQAPKAETHAAVVVHAAAVKASHATAHASATTHAASKQVAAAHVAKASPAATHKAPVHTPATPLEAAQLRAFQKTIRATTNYVITPLARRSIFAGGGPAGGYGPSQVAGAYGVTALGAANQGQGQTIGIIDAFDDTSILNDANAFSTFFGLPTFNSAGGPQLTVFKDSTRGPVASARGTGVGVETALDVEWAHAMAPKANILLIEEPLLNSDTIQTYFGGLLSGIQYAASHGASVVSLSYGSTELNFDLPAVYALDHQYLANAAAKVAVTISSGDSSYPGYPADASSVIGVGGTQLKITATNGYGSESAWGGVLYDGAGGGGPSAFFKSPTFQSKNGVALGGRYRTLPDVALLADPITGVAIYDSLDFAGGWNVVGGTSLASPLFAGMLSIVQQDRVAAGKAILTTPQIQSDLYAVYNSPNYLTYFHDITVGNNSDSYDGYAGYPTTTGYDLATGIGSPIANKLIPYLVSL